jgi:hypothetical protein
LIINIEREDGDVLQALVGPDRTTNRRVTGSSSATRMRLATLTLAPTVKIVAKRTLLPLQCDESE